ncbi:hypothetical protein G7Y89_g9322 [Cudoniella acicularis]|uniref:Major facilitator superfamily (MFS) profile domain-containing protein n=1 Tax=Cudoniella acicularis TaxID=354080 RepID=A0A8H4RHN4_9HELO|nr:hypothetical protein G7Y89_g9322 [Cudoniella acicularis]
MTVVQVLRKRVRTARPTYDVSSPLYLLSKLDSQQWKFLCLGFWAWTWDAFDYFSITLVMPHLQQLFDRSNSDIALALSLSLMPRFVGAAIFGIAADRFGRKWPLIINCLLLIVLELAIAFCQTYKEFLACRILFGVAMGGLYGNASATALEDCPDISRGIISGIFQAGYPMGLLLATAFNALLVNSTVQNWRALFYFAAGPPALLIIFRLFLPDTTAYIEHDAIRSRRNVQSFTSEFVDVIRMHWGRLSYMIIFMMGCTYLSHGSQDILQTMLRYNHALSSTKITTIQTVGFLGSLFGSLTMGFISDIIGRRFSIILSCFVAGALVYPYFYLSYLPGLLPVVFAEQFFVQGIFGIVPVHLIELSPYAFRTFVVGTSYNLGVLFASPVPYVETIIGEGRPLPSLNGNGNSGSDQRFDYSWGMAIVFGCAVVFTMVVTFLGPENKGGSINDEDDDGSVYQAPFSMVSPVVNGNANGNRNGRVWDGESWSDR